MKKKSNLKLINVQTEEQARKQIVAKHMAVSDARDKETVHLSIGTDQRRALLYNFLDRGEQTVFEPAFQLGEGLGGMSQSWSEGLETPEFIEHLHPWLTPQEERINAALLSVEVDGDPATQDLDSEFNCVKWTSQETGFKLGVLLGAQLAGYSPAKVRTLVEYLVDTLR